MFGISLGGTLGIAAIIAAIAGLILKKTNALAKIREFGASNEDAAERLGFNIGVILTTWFNKIPVINVIYENSIEPIFITVFEVIGRLLMKILLGFPSGMRSDNQKLARK